MIKYNGLQERHIFISLALKRHWNWMTVFQSVGQILSWYKWGFIFLEYEKLIFWLMVLVLKPVYDQFHVVRLEVHLRYGDLLQEIAFLFVFGPDLLFLCSPLLYVIKYNSHDYNLIHVLQFPHSMNFMRTVHAGPTKNAHDRTDERTNG